MPNRIIKESICTSKDINRLTSEQEVFWYRLIVNCDDHGYLDADPSILRAKTFPRRIDTVTDEHIVSWLQALVSIGMVTVFEVSESFYLRIPSWTSHQQVRASRSKFPQLTADCRILQADEITCHQLISDDIKCPRNPIQSNPNPIQSESNPKQAKPRRGVDEEFILSLKERFPNLAVETEWDDCQRWYVEHRKQMKAPQSCLINWLKKAAERKGNASSGYSTGLPGNRPGGAFSDVEG